jgi:hypothetical protein
MERAERRSRAVFARPALTAPHLHLPARISDRQFLARLENAATRRKQTPEADSNRHFWQGGPPIMQCLGYAEAGNFRCLAGRQISNRQWAGGAPFAAGRVIFFGCRVLRFLKGADFDFTLGILFFRKNGLGAAPR